MERPKILIIEGDTDSRKVMEWVLRDEFDVTAAGDTESALSIIRDQKPKAVFLDVGICPCPYLYEAEVRADNQCFLLEVQGYGIGTKVIFLTDNPDLSFAAEGICKGAYDYLVKPVDLILLRYLAWRACWAADFEWERSATPPMSPPSGDEIIGTNEKIREVLGSILKVAAVDIPVLVVGESGTGKELTARAIHDRSLRKHGPFVPINCGAIPDNLLESELFGYEKGAFTGATRQKKGKIEYAQGGTLFLDEVGELPVLLQVKLLRFLEDHKIERVGGREPIQVDARIVAAANQSLQEAVRQGKFRDDLYYRLAVVSIDLPPLRERGDDVLLLAKSFFERANKEYHMKLRGFTPKTIEAIKNYSWPGNVRELLNKIRRAVVMAEGPYITPRDIDLQRGDSDSTEPVSSISLKEARRRVQQELLVHALTRHRGNVQKVADELKISRPAVYYLLDAYGLRERKSCQ